MRDALDRIDTIQNLEGQTSSYEWVASGRLASVTRYDGTTVSNQWNAAGRLAARVWPGGTNSYTYYSNGMLESAAHGDCVISNQVDSGGLLLRQDVDMVLRTKLISSPVAKL